MKFLIALAATLVSFQASASHSLVSETDVRAALNSSPALVGAVKEIRKSINTTDCRKLEIVELKQTGSGSAVIKVHGVCFNKGTGSDEGESAAFFTLEGTMMDKNNLLVEKIEFGFAG